MIPLRSLAILLVTLSPTLATHTSPPPPSLPPTQPCGADPSGTKVRVEHKYFISRWNTGTVYHFYPCSWLTSGPKSLVSNALANTACSNELPPHPHSCCGGGLDNYRVDSGACPVTCGRWTLCPPHPPSPPGLPPPPPSLPPPPSPSPPPSSPPLPPSSPPPPPSSPPPPLPPPSPRRRQPGTWRDVARYDLESVVRCRAGGGR
jgi:hypothetical protein